MTQPLHVIILAAGAGKRMKSVLPKVLQPIAGQPMLAHVIAAARELEPAAIHVVYGHGGEAVRQHFADQPDLQWAEQAQQLGTGHAVAQAMPQVPDAAQVLVLYGDVPLIRAQTLRDLLAQPGRLAVLVADVEDPTGYGRVLRDAEGKVGSIVEQKDANDDQLRVRTINTGIIAAGRALTFARILTMSLLRSLLMLPLLALAGCATDAARHWVELDGARYQVELATNDETRARGLMFRDQMAADHGMLFIHDREEMQAYWMKNTKLALDILYFDSERKLVSQQRDVPPCSAGDMCPPYPSGGPARYVLELNAGQAEKLKLKDGTELTFGPGIE